MAAKALAWSSLKGGQIGVGFDDGHFGAEQMRTEVDLVGQAYPNLPDEVLSGTSFVFGKDGTGHLTARFKVGDTVYRSGGQRDDLHRLCLPGVFACGGVRLSQVKRVASAVGEGSMAIAFVHKYLQQDAR